MKKLVLLALAAGIIIPVFAQVREFYYFSVLALALFVVLLAKKGPLTIIDALLLYLIAIPLHTFRFGTTENFIRLSEIAFIPLFFWWVIQKALAREGAPVTIRQEFLLLGAYLVMNILSTRNSMYPAISVKRIMILAYLFLFTYMVGDIINRKDKMDAIVKAMVIISGLSAVVAIFQSIFPQLIIFTPVPVGKFFGLTFYRAGVGRIDPNYYALYLAMSAALTLSCLLASKAKNTVFRISFLLQMLGLLATFSRTAFIAFSLAAVYLLFAYGRRNTAIVCSVAIAATTLVLASSTLAIYQKAPFVASVVYRVADKAKVTQQPSLIMGHRLAAFKANWAMFEAHPLLGVGPFMAMYNFEKYKPAGYNYPLAWLASHNQYLQLLSEKGIFGFLFFMGFLVLILLNINRYLKQAPQEPYRGYLIGFKTALLIYLIASFALETSYELQFWLMMGMTMALFQIINKEKIYAS